MWKQEAKTNLTLLMKAGLPFTVVGMIVIFAGLYLLKQLFADNEYLVIILFAWLAVFWAIYQPMFKRRMVNVKNSIKNH